MDDTPEPFSSEEAFRCWRQQEELEQQEYEEQAAALDRGTSRKSNGNQESTTR
jgi:hypothetical protein